MGTDFGATAIWSEIACKVGWKYYLALESGVFGVVFAIFPDRVATKSMDSRGDWDGLRCDSDLVRNCMQIGWKCYPALESGIFGVIFVICSRPGGYQIDGL